VSGTCDDFGSGRAAKSSPGVFVHGEKRIARCHFSRSQNDDLAKDRERSASLTASPKDSHQPDRLGGRSCLLGVSRKAAHFSKSRGPGGALVATILEDVARGSARRKASGWRGCRQGRLRIRRGGGWRWQRASAPPSPRNEQKSRGRGRRQQQDSLHGLPPRLRASRSSRIASALGEKRTRPSTMPLPAGATAAERLTTSSKRPWAVR
jgi:hypothetical protein